MHALPCSAAGIQMCRPDLAEQRGDHASQAYWRSAVRITWGLSGLSAAPSSGVTDDARSTT
jgi:hypothetical protein